MSEQPCAFHPDRLTGVRCARCERPICPDDMIDAPVGVQCPICAGRMREGALGERSYRVRTRLERTRTGRQIQGLDVSRVLLGANIAVFLLMLASGRPQATSTLVRFGALLHPLPGSEWWRLFSSMFVHIGFLHLAFNCYALYAFGPPIEARHGKVRFLTLYLGAGLLGGAASLAFTGAQISAGASGAVFGILGAWIAFFLPHRRARGAAAQLQSLFMLIGINLVLGFSIGGIDNWAHLGGLAGGFVIGSGLEFAGKRPRGPASLAGAAGYVVVLVTALVLIVPNLG